MSGIIQKMSLKLFRFQKVYAVDNIAATNAIWEVDPAAKVKYGHLLFTHLEGGTWQYLSVDRYESWADFGADRSTPVSAQGWADVRMHSASHTDTIADRVK